MKNKKKHAPGPEALSAPAAEEQEQPVSEQERPKEEALAPEDLGIEENKPAIETERSRLRAMLEAAVYIAEDPVTVPQLVQALGQPKELVDSVLAELVAEYSEPHHGIAVREVAGGFKMSTKPEYHEDIRAFVKKLRPPLKLSLAALETLAVVAYKQPITAPEILEIRGVQGGGVLKTLLERKLITAAGRKQVVGRPVLYKTTKEFLMQFGLKDLAELPTLKEFEEWSRLALGEGEEPQQQQQERPTPAAAEAQPEAEAPAAQAPEPAPEPQPEPEPEPETAG